MVHNGQRYYVSGLTLHPLGARRMLLVSDALGPVGEIDPAVGQLLLRCRGSRSLDQHVTAVCASGLSHETVAIRQTLEQLIQAGLLKSEEELQAGAPDGQPVDGSISTVAIVTADRPASLRRCLAALVSHCQQYGASPRVLVIDGSRHIDSQVLNRQALTGLVESDGLAHYIGPSEAERWRKGLIGSGFAESLVTLALTPGAVGANRNLALLATTGENILMLDDDVLCAPWTLAVCGHQLALGGHYDEREVEWFEARASALGATLPASVDLLKVHGAVLGQTLSALVSRRVGELDLTNACSHLLTALENQEPSTVRATLMGIAGDSGTYGPDRQLFSAGATRARLASDLEAYRCAMRSREVLRISRKCLVTHEAGGMAYAMGVSNRTPPPPFLPAGRNEDGVFSAMVSFLDPAALFAHLPFGVIHDSDRPSSYADPPMQSATQTRIADLCLAIMRVCASTMFASSSDIRRQRLAAAFDDIAKLPREEFLRFSTRIMLLTRSEELRLAHAEACPPHFTQDLQRYASVLMENVRRPDFFVPVEMKDDISTERALCKTQSFLQGVGELIQQWPEIWATSRQLDTGLAPAAGRH
jgi:hypothetical protein